MIEHARLRVILSDMWLFFRNPAYAGHRSKPASKHDSVTHIWEDTETLGYVMHHLFSSVTLKETIHHFIVLTNTLVCFFLISLQP